MVGAAIDIGSTSVHLLVAAVGDHLIEPLLDESVFLGLGDRVAADGYLGAAARESLVEVLAAYVETARHLGAVEVTLIGTEPLRRAEDGPAIVHAVEARTGAALHVLDHDEEGMLTLLGVTMGRALHSELLVLDIGGGSTELVFVGESGPVRVAGLRLGAAGLTRDLVRADPPSLAETGAMRAAAHRVVADAPTGAPADVVAVGGTASNLLRLLPASAVDRLLTRRRITVALAMLAVERSADAAARHLIRPERARILPAGAIIVDAILEHYGVDRLRVSEGGMREGRGAGRGKGGPGMARPAARARARVGGRGARAGLRSPGREGPGGYSPATSRPIARRKARLETPRHAGPTVRRRRASSRSRSTRYRPIAALSRSDRSPACSTRNPGRGPPRRRRRAASPGGPGGQPPSR